MKKKSISFSLFIIIMNVSAQETLPGSKTIPVLKKNEISINTAPVLRLLLNPGQVDATRFSVAYKRNLNETSTLRFSIVADMINNDVYNNINSRTERIILKSDSVMIKQKTELPSYVSPHLNLGYERLFGKRNLKWFYGADLTLGYSESRIFKQNFTLFKDSIQAFAWMENESFPETISNTKIKTFSMGISPFFGAKYPISKRFSISAQVGFDMVYRKENISENKNNVIKNSRVSTFDFDMNKGVINDISLVYKF